MKIVRYRVMSLIIWGRQESIWWWWEWHLVDDFLVVDLSMVLAGLFETVQW